MQFDFENAEAFTPSLDALLPVGNHRVRIDSAKAGKNKNGNLEFVVEASNSRGKRTDWIYYGSEFGQRKVAGLCVATGVRLPREGDWDSETGVLTEAYCNLFVGKDGGMIVREEKGDDGKTRDKVRGWVHPTQIDADTPADVPAQPAVPDDDDIPF